MSSTVPDDILALAALTERDTLIEFACRLDDADRLRMTAVPRLAGLDRIQLEIEPRKRRIPVWRPTPEEFAADDAEIRRLRKGA